MDAMKAHPMPCASSAGEAHTLSTPTGPRQNEESTATLTGEIEARPMPCAAPGGEAGRLSICTQLLQDEESMPTLTDEIRTFIVKGLACFDTPSQVVEAVKTNFAIEIGRQHVYAYDPKSSQRMSPRWRELHAATRQAYLQEVAGIGIAQKAVRLAMLDRMVHHALAHNYTTTAAEFLEQAAKECGGIYENRRPVVLQLTVPQPSVPPQRSEGMLESVPLRQLPDLHDAGEPGR
jgi:hypothetical protein